MIIAAVLVFLITFVFYSAIKSIKRPRNYPPGPTFYPWVGNTFQVRHEAQKVGGQHILFQNWAKDYNSNIIGLKLGSEYTVVVHTYPLVKQIHLSEIFEGRPNNFFFKLRTMGKRRGLTCTDGKLWYDHRHFIMKQLRSIGYGRTPMEVHITEEAKNLIHYINEVNKDPVSPNSFLAASVINVLWRFVTGKEVGQNDKRLEKLFALLNKRSKAFDLCGSFLAQIPWLRYIAPNMTGYSLICQLNKELHSFIMSSINEHKQNFLSNKEQTDLIYSYLKEMESQKDTDDTYFNESQLVMVILDLFIAGSHTTSTTINLALMMLMIDSDIQEKIFKEIQANFGVNELPHLSSRTRLPYLNAFIMEIQRFFHIIPITGPRRALYASKLGGYDIPKNATVLISLQSVLMDEVHWKDPSTFRPERFLTADQKIITDEYFIPFGQGRRRCFADILARSCLLTFLAAIVQNFKLEAPKGTHFSTILAPGIVLSPKPYKIVFSKRNME